MEGLVRNRDGIVIDGSIGEGGGQILRTALGLAIATGRPFRMERIRARRSRAGLLRQHATAVAAAAAIAGARVRGGEVGSETLSFEPRAPKAGSYSFTVGTAGSTALVLHAILPGLLAAEGESEVVIEGGTDAPSAPSFDHLVHAYAPWLRRMGAEVEATIDERGFYPAGGGRIRFRVRGGRLTPIRALEREPVLGVEVVARIAGSVPHEVAERELAIVAERLAHLEPRVRTESVRSRGPGNALIATVHHAGGPSVFAEFGEKGVRAEHVANDLVQQVLRFLASDAAVDEYTADQLVLLLALAGGGAMRTTRVTDHLRTQLALIPAFLPREILLDGDRVEVR